jgi:FKBP-type peptidyl-prolyl cis-trans isomerase (trigger factor)
MEKNTGKTYADLKKTEDKRGEIEFSAILPTEVMEIYIGHALAHAAQDVSLPGFRKGKVPLDMVRARTDEMALLEDAADEALRAAVREILTDENLSIVGSPQLTITKIAPKNPIEFKVRFAHYPAVALPDYKKIAGDIVAKKEEAPEVTEADMQEAITRLLAMIAMQNPELDTDKEKKPELTDEMVGKLGPFKTVEEFKIKLKENLAQDKALQAKDARREEVMHEIVQQASVAMPKMLIDQEWSAFEDRRNEELAEAKLSLADYLKATNKTEAQLEKEERGLIEERMKTSMVFREIQKAENVTAPEKEIQTNIAYLKLRYPDRSEAWLRESAEALIIQEKIFALLGAPVASDSIS